MSPRGAWVVLAPIDDPRGPPRVPGAAGYGVALRGTGLPRFRRGNRRGGTHATRAGGVGSGFCGKRDMSMRPFRKRKRREIDVDQTESGRGDPRIRQGCGRLPHTCQSEATFMIESEGRLSRWSPPQDEGPARTPRSGSRRRPRAGRSAACRTARGRTLARRRRRRSCGDSTCRSPNP